MGMPENDEALLGSDRLKGILFGNYTPLEINAALTPLEQSLSNEESATWKAIGEFFHASIPSRIQAREDLQAAG